MIARGMILYVLFSLFLASSSMAAQGSADRWTDNEMGKSESDPKGLTLKLPLQPPSLPIPPVSRCRNVESPECMFQFTYFLSKGFDATQKQRLNILFIPGGPGAIVDTSNSSLALKTLERQHNIVYLHPRGMGQSAINGDKDFDQFLRADYVVEDIERLRQELFKSRPWDAIYAHSWGTTIAQRYAARFGRPKDPSPKVMSLVLSGPVDRHRADTQGARRQMIVENFKMILGYYRSQGSTNCQCESAAFLKALVIDFTDPQVPGSGNQLRRNDNLCFLKTDVVDRILKQLAKTIEDIDENYGSADLIVDNFETLKKDRDFQKRFEKLPIDFFVAVRFLQMSGAPVKDGLVFNGDSRNRINAALLIAHYLTATNPDACDPNGALFGGAPANCEPCERLKRARIEQEGAIGGRQSLRGSYVFGIYDGVTRWVPAMMRKPGCFTGKDLATFAEQSGGEKKFGRDQVKRVGVVPGAEICPWNPADHGHEVPTLLIKGSRDTVVAGCQAEDFFSNGLQDGRRVFLEIRGLGHDLSVANMFDSSLQASDWSKTYAGLLEEFIKMSGKSSAFRTASTVRAKLKKLMITDRTDDSSVVKCSKTS